MSLKIQLDKSLYSNGVIVLTRGDAWNLSGKFIDTIGTVDQPFFPFKAGFSGLSGYFPAEQSTTCECGGEQITTTTIEAVAASGECGDDFKITLDPEKTKLVALNESGVDIYLVLSGTSKVQTIFTSGQPIAVRDRNFTSY